MRLREASWTDIAAMAAIEAASFPDDAWSEATFWAELAQRPRRSYVVAVDEGDRVAGYAGLDLAGEVADVMTIAVDPRLRGTGAGRTLLEELHTRAVSAGATSVLLEVRADNAAARHLYARDGYQVLHRRAGYYRTTDGTPPVDALVMGKELSSA